MNKESKLHIVIGLPRAGKSTLCRSLGYPIVEGDAIRKVLNCFPFKANMEAKILRVTQIMVAALFEAGHKDVILDDCSTTSRERNRWAMYTRVFHEVRTSREDCIQNAIDRDQDYLVPIIKDKSDELTWPLDCPYAITADGSVGLKNIIS